MKTKSLLLIALLVFLAPGCAGYRSWQADHGLHRTYVGYVHERIGTEEGVGPEITPEANPVVIFENLDRGLLHVVVTSTRGRERTAVKFQLKAGEVKVFPRDVPEAPKFQYGETYSVRWSRATAVIAPTTITSLSGSNHPLMPSKEGVTMGDINSSPLTIDFPMILRYQKRQSSRADDRLFLFYLKMFLAG